ncbi:MAG: polymer-forming cytoskeletal protein [Planctomycetota bacterium]|nr:polymer-forming cytoskeletal protein [Planctomycetota bacterium]
MKTYLPVNDLQTCGKIKITKRGRVAARLLQCGEGIECEGSVEGEIETDGHVKLGPKASWKGKTLRCGSIDIAVGAQIIGEMKIPWKRPKTKKKSK